MLRRVKFRVGTGTRYIKCGHSTTIKLDRLALDDPIQITGCYLKKL